MQTTRPSISKDEFTRRGREWYEREVRPSAVESDNGKFVAIDIESGNFEIDRNDLNATEKLLARCPNAKIWLTRVGHRTAYRIGPRPAAKAGVQ
jgi:hypothetical protein